MMTIPSIDLGLVTPIATDAPSPLPGGTTETPCVPAFPLPQTTPADVRAFEQVLAKPIAENAALQKALEQIVAEFGKPVEGVAVGETPDALPCRGGERVELGETVFEGRDSGRAASMKPPQGETPVVAPVVQPVATSVVEAPVEVPVEASAKPVEGAAGSSNPPYQLGETVPEGRDTGRAASMRPPIVEAPVVAPVVQPVATPIVETPVVVPVEASAKPVEGAAGSSNPPYQLGEIVPEGRDSGRAASMRPPQGETPVVAVPIVETPVAERLVVETPVVGQFVVDYHASRRGGDGTVVSSSVASAEVDAPLVASTEVDAAAVVLPVVAPLAPEQVAPTTKAEAIAPVDVVRQVVAASAPARPADVLVQAAKAVADTLYVTPGLLRGQGEVRIQLRPDILEGSELRLVVQGRQLSVEFLPQTPEMAVLIEKARPQLEQHLTEHIHRFQVTVDVRRRELKKDRV